MKIHKIISVASIAIILTACTIAQETEGNSIPADPTETPAIIDVPTPTPQDGYLVGEAAFINDVQLEYSDSDSGIIEVVIDGSFPDGCTELADVLQTQNGSTLTIRLMTTRPLDADCTMALKPFVSRVPVDLSAFTQGKIVTVDVYGVKLEVTVGMIDEPVEEGG